MSSKSSFWLSPKGMATLGLIAAASYFLLMEHRQHLFEFLPFFILLLCPLMHVFMHRGHGHTHSNDSVDMDDYRRGYDDALNDAKDPRKKKEDNNAR